MGEGRFYFGSSTIRATTLFRKLVLFGHFIRCVFYIENVNNNFKVLNINISLRFSIIIASDNCEN